jgi:hypothetical protein
VDSEYKGQACGFAPAGFRRASGRAHPETCAGVWGGPWINAAALHLIFGGVRCGSMEGGSKYGDSRKSTSEPFKMPYMWSCCSVRYRW